MKTGVHPGSQVAIIVARMKAKFDDHRDEPSEPQAMSAAESLVLKRCMESRCRLKGKDKRPNMIRYQFSEVITTLKSQTQQSRDQLCRYRSLRKTMCRS
jgi:hypothetical protein